jgi:alpha-D-ribose 1-methylphosphonate 5-triphosphate synthase subunit PhnL
MTIPVLALEGVSKSFVVHARGGIVIPVVADVALEVHAGECVVLGGPSGAGKSSLLKMVFGSYGIDAGSVRITPPGEDGVDLAQASPRVVLGLRRTSMGYVSQFLRVVPRVSALDVVAEAAIEVGRAPEEAREAARALLERLNLPARLHDLPPATFSGGEQQRVNIARGFLVRRPLLLLDEPTASLDARNRAVVVEMIREMKASGVAILGIFHDEDVRDAVADRIVDVTAFAARPSLGAAA